jgi:hypothetical protein
MWCLYSRAGRLINSHAHRHKDHNLGDCLHGVTIVISKDDNSWDLSGIGEYIHGKSDSVSLVHGWLGFGDNI